LLRRTRPFAGFLFGVTLPCLADPRLILFFARDVAMLEEEVSDHCSAAPTLY
jgi:hypothetical protein